MGALYNQDENFLPKHLFPALAFEERSIFQSFLKLFIRQSLRQGKKLALCGRGFRGMAGIIAFAGEISGSSSEKSCNDSYIFGFGLRLSGFPIAENATVLSELVCKKGFFYPL